MDSAHTDNTGNIEAPQATIRISAQAWAVCLVASLFFAYELMQMNFIDSISNPLMAAFHINSTQLGFLGSSYLIANVLFLLPAGALLDRFSTRRMILITLGICIIGTALLSTTSNLKYALFYRFLTGIGGAFCLVSTLRLATHWFPANKMAKITGIIIFIAMLGGMLSQTPVAIMAKSISWQKILLIDAGIGLLFWVLIAAVVKDTPPEKQQQLQQEHETIQSMSALKSLKLALGCKYTWVAGLYTSFMNLPLSIFGITWGVLLLSSTHHLNTVRASEITTLMFIGTIIGCPLTGWISDKWRAYRLPMAVGAISAFALMLILLYAPNLSFGSMATLSFLIGLATSTQILGYPVITETSPKTITAMSLALGALLIMGSQAIVQPLFGYLIDHSGHISNQAYHSSDFKTATLILPVVLFVSIFLVYLMPKLDK